MLNSAKRPVQLLFGRARQSMCGSPSMGNLAPARATAGGANAGISRMPVATDHLFVPNDDDNVREELEFGA